MPAVNVDARVAEVMKNLTWVKLVPDRKNPGKLIGRAVEGELKGKIAFSSDEWGDDSGPQFRLREDIVPCFIARDDKVLSVITAFGWLTLEYDEWACNFALRDDMKHHRWDWSLKMCKVKFEELLRKAMSPAAV